MSEAQGSDGPRGRRWIDDLPDEDLAFVRRFILASGSLKALAAQYGISYPTVRQRLDRLIEKVRLLSETRFSDAFDRELRLVHAEGKIDLETLEKLRTAHERSLP